MGNDCGCPACTEKPGNYYQEEVDGAGNDRDHRALKYLHDEIARLREALCKAGRDFDYLWTLAENMAEVKFEAKRSSAAITRILHPSEEETDE